MKKTIVTLLFLCFILASCTTSKNCNKRPRINTEMGNIKKHRLKGEFLVGTSPNIVKIFFELKPKTQQ